MGFLGLGLGFGRRSHEESGNRGGVENAGVLRRVDETDPFHGSMGPVLPRSFADILSCGNVARKFAWRPSSGPKSSSPSRASCITAPAFFSLRLSFSIGNFCPLSRMDILAFRIVIDFVLVLGFIQLLGQGDSDGRSAGMMPKAADYACSVCAIV
ncbi:hypothetical protein MUK42_05281 [Musa troglodytarum]|uniref:Uncharacterized protein n=1 Tax=Musa troglodytarum TaxID=320322 RepID=A0A9E7LD48_9LILI|nr:hypothetical protein MUK42_05281 [Musa troglodytarum]